MQSPSRGTVILFSSRWEAWTGREQESDALGNPDSFKALQPPTSWLLPVLGPAPPSAYFCLRAQDGVPCNCLLICPSQ